MRVFVSLTTKRFHIKRRFRITLRNKYTVHGQKKCEEFQLPTLGLKIISHNLLNSSSSYPSISSTGVMSSISNPLRYGR